MPWRSAIRHDLNSAVFPQNGGWTLDDASNWGTFTEDSTTFTRGHGTRNEITSHSSGGPPTTYTYDDNGNLINDGTFKYGYDFLNRLRTVTPVASTVPDAVYSYDAENRRFTRTYNGNFATYNMHYAYDGQMIVAEGHQDQSWSRIYFNGDDIDEVYAFRSPTIQLGGCTQEESIDPCEPAVGTHYFYHQDDQRSVVAITDGLGVPMRYYAYTPYGEALEFRGTPGGAAAVYGDISGGFIVSNLNWLLQPYLFLGRPYDTETDFQNIRNRYYSPEMGRFISQDSLGIWGDETGMGNAYVMLASSPLYGMDPHGLAKDVYHGFNVRPAPAIQATLRVELFIMTKTAGDWPYKLRGDNRGFDDNPNPGGSRVIMSVNMATGEGLLTVAHTCSAKGKCKSAYAIGDGNTFDVNQRNTGFTLDGKFKNSVTKPKSWSPAVDFVLDVFLWDGDVSIAGKRDEFPSMEITVEREGNIRGLCRAKETNVHDLYNGKLERFEASTLRGPGENCHG